MDPILIDVPARLVTEHLVLRPPTAGDGPKLWEAIVASLPELLPWMPWASPDQGEDGTERFARGAHSAFVARSDLAFVGFGRVEADAGGAGDGEGDGDGAGEGEGEGREGGLAGDAPREGPVLVSCGLHRIDWDVPRFEIGYWRRTGFGGLGLVDEAVHALTDLAFGRLGAQRVEIRMDARNARSARVAERCGFTFEGCLRRDARAPDGLARDTRVYAKVRGVEWREDGSAPAPAAS